MNGNEQIGPRLVGDCSASFQRDEGVILPRINHFRAHRVSSSLPKRRPTSSTRSFSSRPFGPIVPVSWPPWPGSITILPIFKPRARIKERSPLAVGLASRISRSDVPLARPRRACVPYLDVARRLPCLGQHREHRNPRCPIGCRDRCRSAFSRRRHSATSPILSLLPEHFALRIPLLARRRHRRRRPRRPPFSPPRSERPPALSRWSLSPRNSTLLRLLV